jgi:membrane-associated protein
MKWLDPYHMIEYGGLTLMLFCIFAESGLLFGIFLPGDSLLIAVGLMASTKYIDIPIHVLLILINIAAIGGYMSGYAIGYQSRHFLLDRIRKKRRRNYLVRALVLFRKNKTSAMLLPRFLPFIRTFIPIAAGMTEVRIPKFILLNVIGSVLWTTAFVLPSYYLGKAFPQIINSMEWIIIILVLLLSIPFIKMLFHQKSPGRQGREAETEETI